MSLKFLRKYVQNVLSEKSTLEIECFKIQFRFGKYTARAQPKCNKIHLNYI